MKVSQYEKMTKFKNKYRIESNRLPGWDYSGNGVYFITIVVQGRKCLLGKFENGRIILSEFGKIAEEEWHKSFEIRKELILDEFHRKPKSISSFVAGYKTGVTGKIDDFIDFHKLPIEKFNRNNRFWQPNYHDHIIRNEKEYWRIKNYIKNNPENWNDNDCWE